MARIAVGTSLLVALACGPGSENDSTGSGTTFDMPGTSSGTGATSADVDSSTGAMTGVDSTLDGSTSSTSGAPTSDTSGDGSTTTATTGTDSSTGDASSSSTGDVDVSCTRPPDITTCDDLDNEVPPTAYQAIGIGCPGDPASTVPLVAEMFAVDDPLTWGIFGTIDDYVDPSTGTALWAPRQGGSMLVLSTGQFDGDDLTDNPDDKPMPAPIVIPVEGSDLAYLQFTVVVPEGVHGFAIDALLYSEEWPESVGTTFNDGLLVWEESESHSGNICMGSLSYCSVSSLWPTAFQPGAAGGWNPGAFGIAAAGAGATGWMELQGFAEPGEELQITIALFDGDDPAGSTVALIDGFRWLCEPPV